MGDLPTPWFWVHPTTMIHPIIGEVSGRTGYFQATIWEPRGLPLGDQVWAGLMFTVHLWKYAVVFYVPLSSRDVHLGITNKIRLTTRWSNSINHTGGNTGVNSIFFFPNVNLSWICCRWERGCCSWVGGAAQSCCGDCTGLGLPPWWVSPTGCP